MFYVFLFCVAMVPNVGQSLNDQDQANLNSEDITRDSKNELYFPVVVSRIGSDPRCYNKIVKECIPRGSRVICIYYTQEFCSS